MLDLSFWLQLATSVTTIASVYAIGNKSLWGPRIACFANVIWWTVTIYDELWGVIPLQIAMTFLNWRNLIKWEQDAKETR